MRIMQHPAVSFVLRRGVVVKATTESFPSFVHDSAVRFVSEDLSLNILAALVSRKGEK